MDEPCVIALLRRPRHRLSLKPTTTVGKGAVPTLEGVLPSLGYQCRFVEAHCTVLCSVSMNRGGVPLLGDCCIRYADATDGAVSALKNNGEVPVGVPSSFLFPTELLATQYRLADRHKGRQRNRLCSLVQRRDTASMNYGQKKRKDGVPSIFSRHERHPAREFLLPTFPRSVIPDFFVFGCEMMLSGIGTKKTKRHTNRLQYGGSVITR